MYSYMELLWKCFYDFTSFDAESEELRNALGIQLTKEQRIQLLRLVDRKDLYCEKVSQESFVAGFRLAMGILLDLKLNKDIGT